MCKSVVGYYRTSSKVNENGDSSVENDKRSNSNENSERSNSSESKMCGENKRWEKRNQQVRIFINKQRSCCRRLWYLVCLSRSKRFR